MAQAPTKEQSPLTAVEAQLPDGMHPLIETAAKYKNHLIIGVAAVIVVAVSYAALQSYDESATQSAQTKLGAILIEAAGDERINRLEALLASAPDSVHPAILMELAESAMNVGDYGAAQGYWDRLADSADGDMQTVARMGQAKSLSLAGSPAEAVSLLQDLAGDAAPSYVGPIQRQLAVAAEAAGDVATALAAYRALMNENAADRPFIEFKIDQLENN